MADLVGSNPSAPTKQIRLTTEKIYTSDISEVIQEYFNITKKDKETLQNKAVSFLKGQQINGVWTESGKIQALFPHTKEVVQLVKGLLRENMNAVSSELPSVNREVNRILKERKDELNAEKGEEYSPDKRFDEENCEDKGVFAEGKCVMALQMQPVPVAGIAQPAQLHHPAYRADSLSSDFEISSDSFF
jgi:hypothetical protein